MSKDTISDILTCIRNADMANKETVRIGFTKIVEKIVQILSFLREGFIKNIKNVREWEYGKNIESFFFVEESESENENSDDDSDDEDSYPHPHPHRRRTQAPDFININPCPCCRAIQRFAEIVILIYLWARSQYRRRK